MKPSNLAQKAVKAYCNAHMDLPEDQQRDLAHIIDEQAVKPALKKALETINELMYGLSILDARKLVDASILLDVARETLRHYSDGGSEEKKAGDQKK